MVWFGQPSGTILAVAPIMEPFRELLKKPVAKSVYWDEQLQAIFSSAKDTIGQLAAAGLRYYDVSRPTAAFTDYSRQGIGFLVMQQYCQCISQESPLCCTGGWKLVLCGSRHLTAAEKNYSTLNGKPLLSHGASRSALFLLGCRNLTFITDHKALTRIFGDKELKDINNPRILNLKERTLMYSFRIKYLKGKTNCAADALSRYPMLLGHPEESDEADDELVCATIVAAASEAVEGDGGRVVDIQQVEEEAAKDEEYRLLHVCPTRAGLTARTWSRLLYGHISGCVVTCHAKEILSCTPMMRNNHVWLSPWPSDVLCSLISTGHQGRDSMLRRARQSVYWPGIDAEVEQKRPSARYVRHVPLPTQQKRSCQHHPPSTHFSRS
ncbi:hypothetical protein C7M84_015931 [Penaeus vannamei]|uniref:RNA-directed DNA polymerase n=1 Tax=Penaeus vannamei TaxID=6689 RepID=A0A3R7LW38_PENVA|nr:hypothetical protein C7M84_015931 [Penaeus vannamei]